MRKSNHTGRVFVGATLALIVVTLHPLVGLTFGDTVAPRPGSYSFVSLDIPTPSGELGFTSLADLNEEGELTGGFANSSIGPYGFALDNQFKLTELRCPPADMLNTEPQALNDDGEITGSGTLILQRIKIPEPPFETLITKNIGFVRHTKGRCTILDVPGATLTEAVGVNDQGQVVGDYQDAAGEFHGFVWEAGLFQTLDVPFPQATSTAPTGINNVGQIVGFYFDHNGTGAFPNGHAHGFLSDHGIVTSFDFPSATDTLPVDINDQGQIVGVSSEAPRSKLRGINAPESLQRSKLRGIRPVASEPPLLGRTTQPQSTPDGAIHQSLRQEGTVGVGKRKVRHPYGKTAHRHSSAVERKEQRGISADAR
jgi:probable HAF family extracellular repeat protein